MLPSLALVITSTLAIPCGPDVTELECKLGRKILQLKQDISDLKAELDRERENCKQTLRLAARPGINECYDHGLPGPTKPIPRELPISKWGIAGLATGAMILGAGLGALATRGEVERAIAGAVGGTAIVLGWVFIWIWW